MRIHSSERTSGATLFNLTSSSERHVPISEKFKGNERVKQRREKKNKKTKTK